jgi:hypothetical protein
MKLDEIIKILENRVLTLTAARQNCVNSGDLNKINQIDVDLLSTTNTIEQLKNMLRQQTQ